MTEFLTPLNQLTIWLFPKFPYPTLLSFFAWGITLLTLGAFAFNIWQYLSGRDYWSMSWTSFRQNSSGGWWLRLMLVPYINIVVLMTVFCIVMPRLCIINQIVHLSDYVREVRMRNWKKRNPANDSV